MTKASIQKLLYILLDTFSYTLRRYATGPFSTLVKAVHEKCRGAAQAHKPWTAWRCFLKMGVFDIL